MAIHLMGICVGILEASWYYFQLGLFAILGGTFVVLAESVYCIFVWRENEMLPRRISALI